MKITKVTVLVGVLFFALIFVHAMGAQAAPKPSPYVTMGVTAQTSANGSTPEVPGSGNSNNWVYQYTIHDGESVSDTLPIQVCITEQGTDPWTSFSVQFSHTGGLAGTFTAADLSFTSPVTVPSCQTRNIVFTTDALYLSNPAVSQDFQENFKLEDKDGVVPADSNKLGVRWSQTANNLKIHVTILPKDTTRISCYLTDSDGNFLTDCTGQVVNASGEDDGRFAIVLNKKGIAVATNPGQFYYNVLYKNEDSTPLTVNVGFTRSGVVPKGAQAIHAALFAPPFSGVTAENFDLVNDGIPEGSDDSIQNIQIPAGWTLWVTYHLEWEYLGTLVSPAATCGTADQVFSVTGTIGGTGITTETCTASASGYRK